MDVFNHELIRSFWKITRAFKRIFRESAEAAGLTGVQLWCLFIISKHPNIGLGELADRVHLTNSTISGVVDRLVKAGLIVRETPPHDRRAISLVITDKGREKLQQFVAPDSVLVKRLSVLLELPDEDVQTLLRIHRQILRKIEIEED
ncbi:MarR family winged helix-turn-helix transcriptional regulator [Effusibacillus pohliae]|uniref:MarR family winged helix-turn-helix transcriptional regulator n=1 Tax=Effusibacillus pohliae TaxID=232270 RepID=UPI00036523D8|nr:MarR family transcriptional regulator [Effusibacillus pohliae]